MALLPALETGERVVLSAGAGDLDQGVLRCAPPWRTALGRRVATRLGRLDARRLALLLPVVRRPRRVAQPFLLVSRREIEERFQRSRVFVDRRVPVADRREAAGHGREREVMGVAVVELVP